MAEKLTHLDSAGQARMVDIGGKSVTTRTATAEGRVLMQAATLALALAGDAKKGDVRATAQLAGVMAAKRTAELIPLCHPLALNLIQVDITADETLPGFIVRARVRTDAKTGVEMEALTAVSIACLTIFDMLKAADRAMSIEAIRVTAKAGGASGDYRNPAC